MKRTREELESCSTEDTASLTECAVVTLHYAQLPPESRKQLDLCLKEWARWHADRYLEGYRPSEVLAGSISYQPDLMQLSNDICAWEDKPKPPDKAPSRTMWFNITYEKTSGVPAYDRAVDAPLRYSDAKKRGGVARAAAHELTISTDADGAKAGEAGAAGRPAKRARPATTPNRCFNCGSYSHALRDCWKEYNTQMVEQSKREYEDVKGAGSVYRSAAKRYFLAGAQAGGGERGRGRADPVPLAEEFEDVVPGQVSAELRQAMGLGALDPPPWLYRMRALGLPPSYSSRGHEGEALAGGPPLVASQPQGSGAKLPGPGAASASPAAAGLQRPGLYNGAAADPGGTPASGATHRDGTLATAAADSGPDSPRRQQAGSWHRAASEGCSAESGEIGGMEGQGGSLDADQPGDAAAAAAAEPAEDFIPIEAEPTGDDQANGGLDAGGSGPGGGQACVALFPGVNAPIPQGADPAKWAQPSAGHPLPPGFGSAGHQQRQQAQHMHSTPLQGGGSASRLGRLSGRHPSRQEPTPPFQPGGSPAGFATPGGRYSSPHHHQQQQHQQPPLRHMPSAPALLQAAGPSTDSGPASGGVPQRREYGGYSPYMQHQGQPQATFASHTPQPGTSPALDPSQMQGQQVIYTLSSSGAGHVLTPAASLPILSVQAQAQQQSQPVYAPHPQMHALGGYSHTPPHQQAYPQQQLGYAAQPAQHLMAQQAQQDHGGVQAGAEGYIPLLLPAGGTGQLQGSYPILAQHSGMPAHHQTQPAHHQGW